MQPGLTASRDADIATGLDIGTGVGFGKHMTAHNLPLLAGLGEIVALGFPVLLGASRKQFISAVDGGDREVAGGGGTRRHARSLILDI